MINVFLRELRANLKSTIFWTLGIVALAGAGFIKYGGVSAADQNIDLILDKMPGIMKIAFGIGPIPITQPYGYYGVLFVWIAFVAYAQAVMMGTTMLAKEERDHTSEFLFSKPVSRSEVICGKIFAALVIMAVVATAAWLISRATYYPQYVDDSFLPVLGRTMLGMFMTQLVFFFIGLGLSATAKNHQRASQIGTLVLLSCYVLNVVIQLSGKIDGLGVLTPFRYFDVYNVMEHGLSARYLVVAAAVIVFAAWMTFRRFGKRDLRV